jgi:hypothetical protein
MLVEDDAQVTSPLAHLLESPATVAQEIDQRHAFGVEQLEREPHPLRGILDPDEGVGDISKQLLAPAQVAALVAQRASSSFASLVPCAASAARRVKRCSAMSRVCCSTPNAFAAKRSSCSASTPTPILSAVLPIASAAEIERSTSAPRPPTVAVPIRAPPSVRIPVRSSSAWRPSPFSPPEARARALDALQALLSALADRDQLSLDLAAAFDCQADRIGVTSECHRSGIHRLAQAYHPSN